MEVVKVELLLLRMRLRSPFETSFGRVHDRSVLLVKVHERRGEVGWGEVAVDWEPGYSYETVHTAIHVLKEFLIPRSLKEPVQHPEELTLRMAWVRGHNIAKSGLEMSLWDLYAKLQGVPLAKLIGGVRDRIESGVSVGIQKSLDELLKVVGRYIEEGYRRIKLKIKPGWDVDVVDKVRREYPDVPLQVDANAAYKLSDRFHLKKLDEYNLLMIEQPLDYDDLVDHAELARFLRTPICLDESIKSPDDARRAYKLGSCEVINIKPGRVGGLYNAKRIHDFCQSVDMPVWIGGMLESGVGRGHLVALATLPNVRFPNDISASDRYWEEDIVEPPWTLNRDGTISVPKGPGIGVDVLEERVSKYLVDKIEVTTR